MMKLMLYILLVAWLACQGTAGKIRSVSTILMGCSFCGIILVV